MKSSFLSLLLLSLLMLTQAGMAAEKDPNTFYGRSFSSGGDTLYYRVMYPKGYVEKGKARYPLVVVLHGGDCYSKQHQHFNGKQLNSPVANLFKQDAVKDSFPAIVLFPQCEEGDSWAEMGKADNGGVAGFPDDPEQTYAGEMLERMVKYYIKHYPVDDKRIYIIGMGAVGGSGALDAAVRKPKCFASVVSIGGSIAPQRAKKLVKTPVRLYASDGQAEVPLTLVRDVFLEMKANGAKSLEPVFELSASDEQDCVRGAAASPGFLKWVFSQKRK